MRFLSEVSRETIEAGTRVLKELAERDLSELDVLMIYLDGIVFGEYHVLAAVGVDATGRKHVLVADGQIPISRLLTSASLHDSHAAIPLATLSAERTTDLYDLMDAAYDAEQIREHSRSLGHVPLIDVNPRGNKARAEELRTEARRLKNLGFQLAEQVRYNERTAGERVNGRLKGRVRRSPCSASVAPRR